MPSFDWLKEQVISKSKEVSDRIQRESQVLQEKFKSAITASPSRSTSSDSTDPISAKDLSAMINKSSSEILHTALTDGSKDITLKAARITTWWTRSMSGRNESDFLQIFADSNAIENLVLAVCASQELSRAVQAQDSSPQDSFTDDESLTIVDPADREFKKNWQIITSLMFSEEDRVIIDRVIAGMDPEIVREDTSIRSIAFSLVHCLKADVERLQLKEEARALRHVIEACSPDVVDSSLMRIENLIRLDDVMRQISANRAKRSEARAEAFAAIRAVLEPGLEKSGKDVAEAQKQVAETEAALMDHLDWSEKERAVLLAEVDRIDTAIAESGLESKIPQLEAKVAEIDAELIRIGKQKIDLSLALAETSKLYAEEVKGIKSEIDRLDKLKVSRAGSTNYLKRVKDFIDPLAANRMERKPKDWERKIERLKEKHFDSVKVHLGITEEYLEFLHEKLEGLKLLPQDDVVEMRRLAKGAAMIMLQTDTMMGQLITEPTAEMKESVEKIKKRIGEISSSAPVIDVTNV